MNDYQPHYRNEPIIIRTGEHAGETGIKRPGGAPGIAHVKMGDGYTYPIPETAIQIPTDAELLRHLRVSWEERGRILDKLLAARAVDLAMVAMLIDRSADPDALSELRGVIMQAVESIRGLREILEVKL